MKLINGRDGGLGRTVIELADDTFLSCITHERNQVINSDPILKYMEEITGTNPNVVNSADHYEVAIINSNGDCDTSIEPAEFEDYLDLDFSSSDWNIYSSVPAIVINAYACRIGYHDSDSPI